MRLSFVTLFPELVLGALRHSILLRAESSGRVEFRAANPRDFATDAHRTVDDRPAGGGPGMVLRADRVADAFQSLNPDPHAEVIFLDPNGEVFDQRIARELSQAPEVVFLCGHYEGIDDRVRERLATRTLSLGDFILTGGELASLVIADAVVRLIPGVLGSAQSLEVDAHADGLLSGPNYTSPVEWEGLSIPEVLRSGDHQAASRWRRRWSLQSTRERRPELFCRAPLSRADLDLL
ncbi:MAG TPA: tRNA (guanosine(37)-N1)-methyltransferase TrmD [Fimbriimonadaceae bacterium]|nr:tRNA (guanosine(37)-N1)-methyltransferase TrmD [Fimbriimonadaceae bacterium]HRJ33692.1 tRNA (guanosine(37)-N1)-methyltransferase TrmD [Fimbriimonadaceae bacterium]